MNFHRISLLTFIALIVTLVVAFIFPSLAFIIFPIVSWGGLIQLTRSAKRNRISSPGNFELQVAVETILSFGVVALTVSMATGILVFIRSDINFDADVLPQLQPVVMVFLEGLVSSAIAAAASNYLRQWETMTFGVGTSGGTAVTGGAVGSGGSFSTAPVAAELHQLSKELQAARVGAQDVAKNLKEFNEVLKLSGALVESLDRFFAADPAAAPDKGSKS